MAKRKRYPRKCLTTDVLVKGNVTITMEKERSNKLVSRRGMANQSAEGNKVAQLHLEHTLVNIMGTRAPTSDTINFFQFNTDIQPDGTAITADADDSLSDSTSHNKKKRKEECLDSEVVAQGVENSSEDNYVQNTKMKKLLESGCEMDGNTQSAECRESLPHVDHSVSEFDYGEAVHGVKSVEAFSSSKTV